MAKYFANIFRLLTFEINSEIDYFFCFIKNSRLLFYMIYTINVSTVSN